MTGASANDAARKIGPTGSFTISTRAASRSKASCAARTAAPVSGASACVGVGAIAVLQASAALGCGQTVKECLNQIGHQITVNNAMDCELKLLCSATTRTFAASAVSAEDSAQAGSIAPM
jgi:hypothetical protein